MISCAVDYWPDLSCATVDEAETLCIALACAIYGPTQPTKEDADRIETRKKQVAFIAYAHRRMY